MIGRALLSWGERGRKGRKEGRRGLDQVGEEGVFGCRERE